MKRYQLRPIRGGDAIVLAHDAITIGRHPNNTIRLLDEKASRRHCIVEPDGKGRYSVRDLGSRNGTKINELAVNVATLEPGDVLRVGKVEFSFERAEEVSSTMIVSDIPAETQSGVDDLDGIDALPLADGEHVGDGSSSNGVHLNGSSAADHAHHADHEHHADDAEGGLDAAALPDLDLEALAALEPEDVPSMREASLPVPELGASDADQTPQVDTSKWAGTLERMVDDLPPKAVRESPIVLVTANRQESKVLQTTGEGPRAMRLLLQLASKSRATDLHIEPKAEYARVRMRVDGQMVSVVDLPVKVGDLVIGLLRASCQMRQAAKDAIQDGHCAARFPDRRVDFRVSMTPTVHGAKAVVRVLDQRGVPKSLTELGLLPYMQERVKKVCEKDSGLLLVCGPTGSGKTTTLYNGLRAVDREHRNVITIEDPVEYQIEGTTQMPVDHARGNSFGSMLRSVLRQDPDVILLGEIRDDETARTAMQAAMTGHVVFTTVHAKDTISAVFRLLDLKVEPYLVANALDLVLAQRLVRVLCDECKREVAITPGQSSRIGKHLQGKSTAYTSVGCVRCLGTGFRGRRALFELLEVSNELRDVILREPSIAAIRKIIHGGHFDTLTEFGWRLVADGDTTIDEIERVAGSD